MHQENKNLQVALEKATWVKTLKDGVKKDSRKGHDD